jgi:hypothetical protein
MLAEFDMDSLLLFPPHFRRDSRLVINQSVVAVDLESSPDD